MPFEQANEIATEVFAFNFPAPMASGALQQESHVSQIPQMEQTPPMEKSCPIVLKISDILVKEENSLQFYFSANDLIVENKYIDEHNFQIQMSEFKAGNESFMVFDLNMSKAEIEILDSIEVKSNMSYNRFGDLNLLKEELPAFLREATNANENEIAIITHLIDNLSSDVVNAISGETAWITLRASTENHAFDVHRWHTDGHFFSPTDFSSKFATTLKGDPTLFYPLPQTLREEFNASQDNRELWDQKLDDSLIISPQIGQGVIFIVGDPARSAVHSEPKITQDRLFFSVVVGTHSQISELDNRWNANKK